MHEDWLLFIKWIHLRNFIPFGMWKTIHQWCSTFQQNYTKYVKTTLLINFHLLVLLKNFCCGNILEQRLLTSSCPFLDDDVIDPVTCHVPHYWSIDYRQTKETLLIISTKSNKDTIKVLWDELELNPEAAYLKVGLDHCEKTATTHPNWNILQYFTNSHTSHGLQQKSKSSFLIQCTNLEQCFILSIWWGWGGGGEWVPQSG